MAIRDMETRAIDADMTPAYIGIVFTGRRS